ncbi:MAG: DUF3466 family protein [Planctomycetes bacterium]|nr:DUF3466 family protein [Planctomycetota bacterium]
MQKRHAVGLGPVFAALLGTHLCLGGAAALAQNYNVIHLGTVGGNDSESRGLNENGQVVGWSDDVNGTDHAFYWDGTLMTDLGTLGGRESNARDINNQGVICGRADIDYWFQHATRWVGGSIEDLGTLGGQESSAYNINEAGQIVGWADIESGAVRAFLWENGVMNDLGTLGGVSSWAHGLNAQGDVAGYSYIPGGVKHAYLYSGGAMTDLGTLGGPTSRAFSVNDNGVVVGESDTAAGPSHACMWDNGVVTDLGTVGGPRSQAWHVNNLNQVVGWAENDAGSNRAFLWENGVMYMLNDYIDQNSGWNLKEAYSISDAGFISGRGTYNGNTRAFLLVPTGISFLTLGGPDPGLSNADNTFTVDGATPGAEQVFLYGLKTGSTEVPGCQGVFLSLNKPKEIARAVADAGGHAEAVVFVPRQGSGLKVYFQTYEAATCRTSNVVTHLFP